MSKTHALGPWRVAECPPGCCAWITDPTGQFKNETAVFLVVFGPDGNGDEIALLPFTASNPRDNTTGRNAVLESHALLIAVAPELLTASKQLLQMADDDEWNEYPDRAYRLREEMRTAISKADTKPA